MNIFFATYLLVSAVILLILAVIGWRRRFVTAGREFALVAASTAILVGAYATELTQDKIEAFKLILHFEWLTAPYISVFWLLFSLVWCGYGHLATRTRRAALMVIPTVDMLFAQTNEYHSLVYKAIWVNRSGAFPIFETANGPIVWIDLANSTICMSIAAGLFIQQYIKVSPLYRRQALIMMLAALIPTILNLGYYMGIGGGVYYTAFGLTISGMMFAWGMFRHRLLDMTPVARHGLVEMMRDPVLVFNEAGWLVDYNLAARQLLSDSENLSTEITKADILRCAPELAQALGDAEQSESSTFRHAGLIFSLSLSTLHPTTKTTLTLCLLHDITEQSLAEEMLRDEREKLEDALERQIRFVDMVSHEYRTPLAIIKANLDILREQDIDAAARAESINYMQRAVARLVEVVEASFSVSKLAETTAETTQLERIEVADFLAEVCDEATALWRGVILNMPPESTTLNFVLADRSQIKTALFNLIDNAIKFSGKGNPIDIGLGNDGKKICLTVADCGPVISEVELESLRLKYRRGSNAADQDGVGIGLYLVDKIVAQHGGRLLLQPNTPTGMISKLLLPVCS